MSPFMTAASRRCGASMRVMLRPATQTELTARRKRAGEKAPSVVNTSFQLNTATATRPSFGWRRRSCEAEALSHDSLARASEPDIDAPRRSRMKNAAPPGRPRAAGPEM
jgi:hypothetical protein